MAASGSKIAISIFFSMMVRIRGMSATDEAQNLRKCVPAHFLLFFAPGRQVYPPEERLGLEGEDPLKVFQGRPAPFGLRVFD